MKYSSAKEKLNQKKFLDILRSPSLWRWAILLIFRSLVLRLKFQNTTFYFLNLHTDDLIINIKPFPSEYKFSIVHPGSKIVRDFIEQRAIENPELNKYKYIENLNEAISRNSEMACLINNDKIVCSLILSYGDHFIDDIKYLYKCDLMEVIIRDVYTLRDFRNKKLYKLLVKFVKEYLSAKNISSITLWVMKHNRSSINAHLRLGFGTAFQYVTYKTWLGFSRTNVYNKLIDLNRL